MAIKNPDTNIRTAYIAALAVTGLPVWNKRVPINTNPSPKKYITLDSQTKQPFERTKDCFEWLTTLNVDIWLVNTPGYVNTVTLDNIEELAINAIENITIPGFIIQDMLMVNSVNLDIDTPTTSLERRVLTYQIILWQTPGGVDPVGPSVKIVDQLGNTVAVVPAPGQYEVLKFDTIDLHSIDTDPDIVIIPST